MTIEACIAHAIHSNLDIVEALPEIHDLPVEELETYVERYVLAVQKSLCSIISETGDRYLRSHDAAGLCATCLESGVNLPPKMLLKMCQTIVDLNSLDAKFILDTDESSLYFVKMAIA